MITDTISTTISAPVKAPTIEALARKAQEDGVSLPTCAGSALDEWADALAATNPADKEDGK